jgi:hypothetical protein
MNTFEPQYLRKWEWPSDYGGEDLSEFYMCLTHTRDSDLLEESNWDCILKQYPETFDEETNQGIRVVRFGHWACGWFEQIMVHESDFDSLKRMDCVREALNNYLVWDDEDYSRREYEEQEQNVKWEIDDYIRHHSQEDIELSDNQIEQMIYWYCQDCNSNDSTPDDDEIEKLIEKVKLL